MFEVGTKVEFRERQEYILLSQDEREKVDSSPRHTARVISLSRLWTDDRIFYIAFKCLDECKAEHPEEGENVYEIGNIVKNPEGLKEGWIHCGDVKDMVNMTVKEVESA